MSHVQEDPLQLLMEVHLRHPTSRKISGSLKIFKHNVENNLHHNILDPISVYHLRYVLFLKQVIIDTEK